MKNLIQKLNNLTGWNINPAQSKADLIWEVNDKWNNDQEFGEEVEEVSELVQLINKQ